MSYVFSALVYSGHKRSLDEFMEELLTLILSLGRDIASKYYLWLSMEILILC